MVENLRGQENTRMSRRSAVVYLQQAITTVGSGLPEVVLHNDKDDGDDARTILLVDVFGTDVLVEIRAPRFIQRDRGEDFRHDRARPSFKDLADILQAALMEIRKGIRERVGEGVVMAGEQSR